LNTVPGIGLTLRDEQSHFLQQPDILRNRRAVAMQAMCQLIDRLRLVHDLKHEATTGLRQDGEHLLRILERKRDLAFEGLSAISPSGGIPRSGEEAFDIIGAIDNLGHDFLPPAVFYDLQPFPLKPFLCCLETLELNRLDLAHEVAVMVAMGIVEAEHPSVVATMDGVVDIRQLVARDDSFSLTFVAPYL